MAKRGNAGDSGNDNSEKSSAKSSRLVARDAGLTSESKDSAKEKSNFLSDLDSPQSVPGTKKSKTATDSRTNSDANTTAKDAVDSVSRISQKSRESNKRYKDSAKEAHPAGSYCSATKHEGGSSKCNSSEKLRELMAHAQERANSGDSKAARVKTDAQPQMAQSIHIAQNLDFNNLDKGQRAAVKFQASNFESFNPQAKQSAQPGEAIHSDNAAAKSTSRHTSDTAPAGSSARTENPTVKESRSGRSFSAPEYQIHQESLDFYQQHKKAFQTADERFQKLPADMPAAHERHEPQIRNEMQARNEAQTRNESQTRPLRNQKIERIDPYYALNYQLAKDNSLFNPPQGDYRVKSIQKADPVKHPDALALDIPESRLMVNLPATGVEQILHNAEHAASGIPIRAGEILDAVESMMESDPKESTARINHQISDERDERHLIMLLDGKHNGLLFPVKRSGEQAKHEGTIAGITKIFLPDGDFKFVRGDKASGKVHFPNIKDVIAKIKSKFAVNSQRKSESKSQAQLQEQEKTVRTSKTVFPQTVISPQHTGTMVLKELKPGAAEPEPLASQLIKAQKSKQEEAKKAETKETRPESKTGKQDPYQGRLPEIKMSYTKNQQATKDFTKLRPNEKHPVREPGEVRDSGEGDNSTRIRDIFAKFDIQLPRKKLRPEITESGTYKIISNQTSQKLPAVSEEKMDAPYEVANIFKEEDSFPGGDPQNPENQPFPKIASSAAEEPRRSYVVKQGETIEYIAVAELQEAGLAPLIREINEIILQQFFDQEKQEEISTMPAGIMILLPNKKDIIAYRLKVARNRH